MNTKQCSVCKEVRPLENFWKSPRNKDGHHSRCNVCGHKKHPRESLVSNNTLLKWCNKCKTEQLKENFFKNKNRFDGLSGYCKPCQKQSVDNRRKTSEYKTIRKESDFKYRQTKSGKESRRKYKNKYQKHKRKTDALWRLNSVISAGLRNSLGRMKDGYHWETIVGYTKNDLKEHIEKQFQDGMNWGNYGKWQIDHKTPKSWFNFTSVNDLQFKVCWSLDNLQPKWADENNKKNNHYSD